MILQKLVGSIYSLFIEISLWAVPIICMVVSGIFMEGFYWVILGLIGGIVLDVILFGPIIIILNIRESLKNMEK